MRSASRDCGLTPEGSYYTPHSHALTISLEKLGRNSTNHLLVEYECSPVRGIWSSSEHQFAVRTFPLVKLLKELEPLPYWMSDYSFWATLLGKLCSANSI